MLRRALKLIVVAVVVLGVAGVVTALARGRYDSHALRPLLTAAGRRAAPAWTRPCWVSRREAIDRRSCDRVAGRVVWIERHDKDGDGDRHLVLVARLHVRVVKLERSFPVRDLPSIGDAVAATGLTLVGASHQLEIDARSYRASGGPTVRAHPARVRR